MVEIKFVQKKFVSGRDGMVETPKCDGLPVYAQFEERGIFDVLLVKTEQDGKAFWSAYLARDLELAYSALAKQDELGNGCKFLFGLNPYNGKLV